MLWDNPACLQCVICGRGGCGCRNKHNCKHISLLQLVPASSKSCSDAGAVAPIGGDLPEALLLTGKGHTLRPDGTQRTVLAIKQPVLLTQQCLHATLHARLSQSGCSRGCSLSLSPQIALLAFRSSILHMHEQIQLVQ